MHEDINKEMKLDISYQSNIYFNMLSIQLYNLEMFPLLYTV